VPKWLLILSLLLTFGGMCLLPCVAVARVFALEVRCRVLMLFVYSRVGKNRDTRRESPGGAGAACAAWHFTVLFSQMIFAAQKAIAYTALLAAGLFYSLIIYFLNIVINQILRIKFFSKDHFAVSSVMKS